MNEIKVGKLLVAKQEVDTKEVNAILNIAKEKEIEIIYLKAGDTINIDNKTKLEIIYIGDDNNNLNNNSIIARLDYNGVSMLFTGDCEKDQEEKVLNQNIKADILKVAHHGSNTSSSDEFLSAVEPKIALIGVGKNNTFGHPSFEIIDRLKNHNIQIYRTDIMGEIVIEIDENKNINIKTHINV